MERETREIKDSKVLAAMAHPVRRRLMDVLRVNGPSTVSALAEYTGQAVGNISHHLKVLAECELVEEAPELARDRRERWWRRVPGRLRWSAQDFPDDPIFYAASSLNLEHAMNIARSGLENWESYPEEWKGAPFSTDTWIDLSAAELKELSAEVIALFNRWSDRDVPDDEQERKPVFLFAFGTPGRP
ncbi:ArsR/SmtB family transcription factor [Actinocrispum wychmicini]|uniref:Helix-turn-helix protein n=1 Tax=Actinocrispum wychmicini TaxID=1213861 RepID=A0A4R2J750_9PSEU|nr:metalloregulator ArsR/SmtB family transcription factor [Actinocrispum wychmicini]TCO54903.1 helix-turn-helix protein [Actinocrispum wychmicini]